MPQAFLVVLIFVAHYNSDNVSNLLQWFCFCNFLFERYATFVEIISAFVEYKTTWQPCKFFHLAFSLTVIPNLP
jgi:hypothetical protein